MTVQTLPNTASTDEIVDVLNRDGGVILENFLTDEGLCCKHGARPRGVTQLGD